MNFARNIIFGILLYALTAVTPTMAQDTPVIGAAKNATIIGRSVVLDFYLEAFGDVGLENLILDDDLDAVFGVGNYTITIPPALINDPGTLTLNPNYDGSSTVNILSGTLALGATAQVSMEIEILTLSDQGSGFGIYSNQVLVTAESPLMTATSDLSDHGTDPDPDEDGDPTTAGEDDPTVMNFNAAVENPRIGVAKKASPSGNQVTLDFYLENFGDVTLSNLGMPDDLDRVFGFGNYTILSGPTLIDDPATITVNAGYDGSSDTALITSGTLPVGDTAQIQVVVDVTNITDRGAGLGVYQNQVTVSATGPGGGSASDVSDNGQDPDPNGNGNPGDPDEGDVSPFVMGEEPVIGLAKNASSTGNFVTLDFYLENLGNTALSNLSLTDDLDATFGAGNYFVAIAPTFIDDPGTLTLNANFDGSEDQQLIADGTLDLTDTAQIQIVLDVILSDEGLGFGVYENQAAASGEAPGGGATADLSDDGTDPDPNGNGNPNEVDENDVTAFTVLENPVIGVAKDAQALSSTTVNLIFEMENLGNVTLANLSMEDDLNAVFGAGNFVITSRSISGASGVARNNSFNGNDNLGLISGSILPGETATLEIGVFLTALTDQGFGPGVYQNQVTIFGDSPGATTVSDLSDYGTNPDPNDNGNPGDAGEDDPTVILFSESIGVAKDVTVVGNQVTLDFYLENFSTSTLSNLTMTDDLSAVFGGNLYTIDSGPTFVDDPGTLVLNANFDGSDDAELFAGGTLGSLDTAQIRVVLTVDLVVSRGFGMGFYENQVTISATRPDESETLDVSVTGTNPDPNDDDNPDEESASAFNIALDALVGAGKVASTAGTQVTLNFYLENFGAGTSSNLSMPDDLDAVFGAGNYSILTPPAFVGGADGVVLNGGYDGSSDTEMLDATSSLASGTTVQIQMVVDITNTIDQGSGLGVYENQVTVTGTDSNGVVVADLSDNNVDPDLNGDDDPTLLGQAADNSQPFIDGEDDPTPVFVGNAAIGISKHHFVKGSEITIDFYLENLGTVELTEVSFSDNLFGVFGFGNFSTTTPLFLIDDPGTISLNANFDGVFSQNVIFSSTLAPGAKAHIRTVLDVTNVSDQGNGLGVYDNQVFLTATGPEGSITDNSDNGILPDPDGNGNPSGAGEEDPTFMTIGEEVALGLALDVSLAGQQVTFDLYLENIGGANLNTLSLVQDLDEVFGAGNYSLNGTPAIISDPGGGLSLDAGFDGSGSTQLLQASSVLDTGNAAQIRLIVDITVIANQGFGEGVYQSQALASGLGPTSMVTMDFSNDGTDPDPNSNGIPTDLDEDTVSQFIIEQSVMGAAKAASVDGNLVTFTFNVENLGSGSLADVGITDNLDSVFGAGNYQVLSVTPRGLAVNEGFDGSADTVLVSGETIGVGLTRGAEIVVEVLRLADMGSGPGVYSNQVTATATGISDVSHNGTDPDPNGDNEPAENDPTLFTVAESPVIGLAKNAGVSGGLVTFDFYLSNLGTVDLSSMTLTDELDSVLGAGNYIVASAPAFIDDPGTLTLNAGYNGSGDTNLITSGTLPFGDTAQIRTVIQVLALADGGSGLGVYTSQAIATALGPGSTFTSDLSDFGTNPDPNGNNNPGDSGEGDVTSFSVAESPSIGVAKNAGVSNSTVTLDVYLENFGNVVLSNLSIANELDSIFGAGNYTISAGPSFIDDPGTITLNGGYDGSGSTALITSGTLNPADTAQIQITVEVNELIDGGSGLGSYSHQVTAFGDGPSSGTVSDLSDHGTDPDPSGNGNPNEAGENDPTTFTIAEIPVIGVAENAGVSGETVTLDFYLENFGNVVLSNLAMANDLDALFGAGNYSITSGPSLVDDPGTITVNGSFDGSGTTALITSGTLAVDDTAQIQLVVEVAKLIDGGSGIGVYSNQVTASADAPGGGSTADLSDDGTNPDPSGNDDPTEAGENDATPFTITETPVIGAAKSADVSGSDVTLNFYLENFGNVDLSNLTLPEDLDTLFGAGNYSVTAGPTLVDDPGTLTVNAGFNGSADTALISSGTLNYNDTAQIQITVAVAALIDGGSGLGQYSNQVTASADGPGGAMTSDLSDDGTDPDASGNGDPTEAGENDPTTFTLAETPIIGVAKNAGVSGSSVTLDLYLENHGNVDLSNLTLPEDLDTLLGAGNYAVSAGPTLVDDPGTITVNASFDGSADTALITSGTLAPGDTAQIQITLDIIELIDAGSGLGVYSCQVSASGDGPGSGTVSDLSHDGTEPDPNSNNDPTEAGENDPTPFTIAELPVIGVAKNDSVSGATVTLDFYLENFGNVELSNLAVADDLDAILGSGNYSVTSGPTLIDDPGTITINAGYNGHADTALITSGTLAVNDTAQIQIVVEVGELIDGGSGLGVYSNQVTASANAPGGGATSDLSDDATDSDSSGNGDPTEAGENDPTSFTVAEDPVIGVAQNAGVSGSTVTLDFYLENYGNVELSNLAASEDLDTLFGAGNYALASGPTLIDDPGTISVNAGFNGSGDTALFTSGTLPYGDTAQVQITVNVNTLIDAGSGLGIYNTQLTASADGPGGGMTSDLSDDGTDPDASGNGDPTEAGENDVTSFTLAETPVIGVAKNAGVSGDTVTLDFYLENYGNVDLSNLALAEDLDVLFGAGNYNITGGPTLVDDPGTISVNGAFNGSGDTALISSGTLTSGDTAQIQITLEVLQIIDGGSGYGSYSNQVTASADGPGGGMTSDLSDQGTNPDPSGNGDPTEAGENDATTFTVAETPLIGAAKAASVSGNVVTLDFYLQNFGNIDLNSLDLTDNLDGAFGTGNYAIISGPTLLDDPGTITVNAGFNGSGDTNLITSGSLAYADTAQIQIVVEVTTVSDQGSGQGIYSNQASASAISQLSTPVSDLSNEGTVADTNENGDPTDDNNPTNIALDSVIGAAKAATLLGREVTLVFTIENLGFTDLLNLELSDNLDAVFGAGNYSVVEAPSFDVNPGTLALNGSFNGSGSTALLSSGDLDFGASAAIRVVVEVTNQIDQGSGLGVYSNQVTVNAEDPFTNPVSDLSHHGTDPDPNGNGDPTEAGENDPTPINFSEMPVIGVAKNATLNGTEITLDFYLENLGNVDLNTLSLPDNLDAVFGAGNYSISAAPTLVDDPGTLTVNAGYNGSGDDQLISSGTLNTGDTAQIQVVVDVTNISDQGAGSGVYSNQATASALSPDSASTSDLSHNGVNPDPDGDGNPSEGGENDPTPIVIGEEPVIGLAKNATPSGNEIILDLYLENMGNVELNTFDLQDNLETVFGVGNFVIASAPTFIDDPGTLVLNPGYNGSEDSSLIDSGTLQSGDTAQIQMAVFVYLSDQGAGYGNYSNQASVTALAPGGGSTSDLSDHGTDPDINGNGNPNEAGENDPTDFNIPENAVIGAAKRSLVNSDSSNVTLTFNIANLGNGTLNNVSVPDDLDAVFGAGNYVVTSRSISGGTGLNLNNSYNGNSQLDLLTGGSLEPYETGTIEIGVFVISQTDQGFGIGTYQNQVTASGDGTSGTVTDLSDDGSNPDPDGDSNPGGPGEDDPTEILFGEQLGVAKNVDVNFSVITMDFYLENFGATTLSDLTLSDDLEPVFGDGNFIISTAPALIDDPGTLTLNPNYDGVNDVELIAPGSTLSGLDTAHIRMVVTVVRVMNRGFGLGFYENQVTATALNPNGNLTLDVSDSGTDPDPNGNGDPSDSDENDPTQFTIPLDSWPGAAKDASVTGTQITLDFYLENFGTGVSSNISLPDDLDTTFGAGNYTILTPPSIIGGADGILLNGAYDGSVDLELLDPASTLSAGTTVQIQMVIDVTTVTDQGLGFGIFQNQSLVSGTDVNGVTAADFSDEGTEPDSDGDDDPTYAGLADPFEAGENDPTIIFIGNAAIGLAKAATVQGTLITLDFYLENLGAVTLDDVVLSDLLFQAYGFGNFSIQTQPFFINDPGTLQLSTFFNGFNTTDIVLGGSLEPGAEAHIRLVVNIDNVTDQGDGLGVFYNQAEVTALDPGGMEVSDLSDEGVIPDSNGNGDATEAGENDPTLAIIGEEAIIGVAKEATVNLQEVTFDIYVENLGNVTLSNLTLTEDLDAVLGAGNYSLAAPPALISGAGVTLNAAFDGSADTNLFDAADTLGSGSFLHIQLVVDVLTVESQGLGLGFYENQVLVSGTGPLGSLSMDFSDNGSDPDPNGSGIASDSGEDDPTPFVIEIRSLGAAKSAEVNGNQVTFTIFLENLGSVELTDIAVTEDLDAVFGAGNYEVLYLVDPRAIANPNFDGSSDTLLVEEASLLAGTPASIQIIVEVTQITDQGTGPGVYSNQVSATATGTADLSDDGTDPDPNGDDDPTGTGENDPTIFTLAGSPVIGSAKTASVNGNTITFNFYLENFGDIDITNLSIIEDLDAVFGAGNYSVTAAPSLIDDPGTLTLNASFDGSGDQELIASGILAFGDTAQIQVEATVVTLIDSGSGLGVYSNQVTASGDGLTGLSTSDLSDDGTDPDPNGDGDPTGVDENDATSFTVLEAPVIGLAKTASVTDATVTLDFYLENLGNATLNNLSLTDNLDSVLGAGTYTVTAGPSFITDPGTVTLNAGYDGSGDTELIASGTLASLATAQIQITVEVFPLTDQGSGLGIYSNQATASGDGPSGGMTSDLSHEGTDPDPNGNGDPTEAGENNATPFTIAQDPIIGAAKTASVVTRTVSMNFYLENFGNVALENVSLTDDLDATFGVGNYAVTSGPTLIVDPGTLNLNGTFNGSASNDLLAAGSTLALGATAQIQLELEVNTVTDQGFGSGTYQNQATAQAQAPDSTPTSDLSDQGTDTDPNGNSNPDEAGENDPTLIVLNGNIGNFVWHDLNGDGIQDPGEPGIENITLDLYRDSGLDGLGLTFIETQTTDGAGAYNFDDLLAGDYQVDLTDTNGLLTSYVLTGGTNPHLTSLTSGQNYQGADFGFCLPPEITVEPVDIEICNGGAITFSVTATGSALSFQWYKGLDLIPGADQAEFSIDPVSTTDAGFYTCVVTNGCGEAISMAAELSVFVLEVSFDAGSLAQGLNPMVLAANISCDFQPTGIEWENLSTGEIFGQGLSEVTLSDVLLETTEFEVRVSDSLNDPVSARITILVPVLPFQLDYNEDGCNNMDDLLQLLPAWNIVFIDPNGNGFVDIRDFLYINTYDEACVPR